jgi:hypothetical protein
LIAWLEAGILINEWKIKKRPDCVGRFFILKISI